MYHVLTFVPSYPVTPVSPLFLSVSLSLSLSLSLFLFLYLYLSFT